MKKYLLCLVLAVTGGAMAQEFYGMATYESKTTFNMAENTGGADMPELEAGLQEQLAKAFEKTFILYFDKVTSLY